MNIVYRKSKFGVFFRSVALFTILAFSLSLVVLTPQASAQSPVAGGTGVFSLPQPGTMIPLTSPFNPAVIKGIKIFPDNPFRFDFVIDTGDSKLRDEELNQESIKLIKYFLASLTVPEENLWVNLSPYEKDRIITDDFVKTEMGRDMLAQDYLLKQITASLMFPEEEIGQRFWNKIYKKANDLYGTTEIPVNTFNKVWILPEKAVVYQNGETVFVAQSRLKVMLEEDYIALKHNSLNKEIGTDQLNANNVDEVNEVSSSVVRDIIIPELEKEVNEGENFAPLRQIYNSMILATWFKRNLKKSLLGQVYFNQAKTQGIEIEDKTVKERIYNQYLEAFEKGVYDYIKEDYDETTQEVVPRKYFSGGIVGFDPNVRIGDTSDSAMLGKPKGEVVVQSVNLVPPHRTVTNPYIAANIPADLDESRGGSKANILINYPQVQGHGFKARLVPMPGMIESIRQLAHIGWNAEYGEYLEENEKVIYYDPLFDSLSDFTLRQFKERLAQRELLKSKLWNDFENNLVKERGIKPGELQIWIERNEDNFREAEVEDDRINRLLEEKYPMKPIYDRFVEMGGKLPTDEEIRRNYPGFDSNERSINLAAGGEIRRFLKRINPFARSASVGRVDKSAEEYQEIKNTFAEIMNALREHRFEDLSHSGLAWYEAGLMLETMPYFSAQAISERPDLLGNLRASLRQVFDYEVNNWGAYYSGADTEPTKFVALKESYAWLVGKFGLKEYKDDLVRLLDFHILEVRMRAAVALAKMMNTSDLEQLQGVRDEDLVSVIRSWVLARNGDADARGKIKSFLSTFYDRHVRVVAMEAAAELDIKEAVPVLEEFSNSPEKIVSIFALKALYQLTSGEQQDKVRERIVGILNNVGDERLKFTAEIVADLNLDELDDVKNALVNAMRTKRFRASGRLMSMYALLSRHRERFVADFGQPGASRLAAPMESSYDSLLVKSVSDSAKVIGGKITESMIFNGQSELPASYNINFEEYEQMEPLAQAAEMPRAENNYGYRGMKLTREEFDRILREGLIDLSGEQSFTANPALAIYHSFNAIGKRPPNNNFLSAVFLVKNLKSTWFGLGYDIFRTEAKISAEDIEAVWIYDKSLGRFVNVLEGQTNTNSAQSNKPRSSYPVWSVETSGHSQMVPWLQNILPRVLDRKTIAQSTLIHVDFHPDTEEMFMGLNDGNPITFIHKDRLVKELWWVRHKESKAEKRDSNFFNQVSFSVDELPPTEAPVILSIDFDYFISNEKFSADTFKAEDARKAVDTFIDQLRTKNYNIAAVFFATSPSWSLDLIDIVRSRFQERFEELGVRFVQADRDVLDEGKRTARLQEFQSIRNESDPAMLSDEIPGGIDFNPNNLDLQTQGERIDFNIPLNSYNFQSGPINGFTPVIFQTVPVTNIQMWLSEAEFEEGQQPSLVQ